MFIHSHKVEKKGKQLGIARSMDHGDENLVMEAIETIRMLDDGGDGLRLAAVRINCQPQYLPKGEDMSLQRITSLVEDYHSYAGSTLCMHNSCISPKID